MFSTTIKRSVATLGVVAGLLAAAGPASAMGVDGPDGDDVLAMNQTDWEFLAEAEGTQVGSEGVKKPIDDMDLSIGGPNASTSGRPQGVIWDLLEQANAGTQVGSEGVKAPTRADDQVKVSGYTFNPKEIAID